MENLDMIKQTVSESQSFSHVRYLIHMCMLGKSNCTPSCEGAFANLDACFTYEVLYLNN